MNDFAAAASATQGRPGGVPASQPLRKVSKARPQLEGQKTFNHAHVLCVHQQAVACDGKPAAVFGGSFYPL
jgi:hypothetical protein